MIARPPIHQNSAHATAGAETLEGRLARSTTTPGLSGGSFHTEN